VAFFSSSRRRHTRFSRDWSSDVCSSDLTAAALAMFWTMAFSGSGEPQPYDAVVAIETAAMETAAAAESSLDASALSAEQAELMEIGRASCWESVEGSGGAAAVPDSGVVV